MSRHSHNPEKYYVTVPFEEFPRRFGTHGHHSPRHMTLLPWFRLTGGAHLAPLMEALGEFCAVQAPFEVTFGEVCGYGVSNEELGQPVLVGKDQVIRLHLGLLEIVEQYGEILDRRWCGEAFDSPHSSLLGQEPFTRDPVGVWSVLVVGKYVKDERRMNDPDKELSAGFRLRGSIGG